MSANLLKTVQCSRSITSAVIRQKHTLITGEGRLSVDAVGAQRQQPHQQIHQVVVSAQQGSLSPPTSVLMPPNVEELQASEKAQFSPRRTRDTSSARIAAYGSLYGSGSFGSEGVRESRYNHGSVPLDRHVDVYDCSDTVALDSLVQTNVPKPYGLSGQAPSQFSSPDCHGAQDDKYVAGDLQDHHQSTQNSSKKTSGTASEDLRGSESIRSMWGNTVPCNSELFIRQYGTLCYGSRLVSVGTKSVLKCPNLVHPLPNNSVFGGCLFAIKFIRNRYIHTSMMARFQEGKYNMNKETGPTQTELTARQKLQRTVKEYGSTVIVFHVTISLASLGICYLLVSSGVDMAGLIKALGISLGTASEGAAEVNSVAEIRVSSGGSTHEISGGVEALALREVDSSEESLDATTRTAAGAATFVVAYAVHKVFAPARIGITLTATPFIVRYLRRVGFLKPPKPK